MRNIFLLLLLLSACSEEVKKDCQKQCIQMTISDSIPIQFWVNGQETYNEKQICGVYKACFCQPIECDDEITIQFVDDAGLVYYLTVSDNAGEILTRIRFTEVSSGVYTSIFNPSEMSGGCNQMVGLSIDLAEPETSWALQTSSVDNNYVGVAYGNGLFVAVASNGTLNQIMTSPDGETWTTRTTLQNNTWRGITFGNGLFVAVSSDGANRVMTSPDGITWTLRTAASASSWFAVTYGNGLFVAVSGTGAVTYSAMYSTDGITWTGAATLISGDWRSITYGAGLFVAVGQSGAGNRVMTSPDGNTWTSRTSTADIQWSEVAYGNGIFVAFANTGTGNRGMSSIDGITWITIPGIPDHSWGGVTFGDDFFVAVSAGGGSTGTLYSIDGLTWVTKASPNGNFWSSVVFGDGRYVAVSNTGTGNRAMILDVEYEQAAKSDCLDLKTGHDCTVLINYSNSNDFDGINYESISPSPIFSLRIPAQFWKEDNPQEQEDSVLSNGVIVTRRTEIQEKTLLEVGYVPNYLHKKIQKILMHNSVQIEDVNGDLTYWKKRDAYEAENLDRYPLKTGNVWLTKYNSVEKNTI